MSRLRHLQYPKKDHRRRHALLDAAKAATKKIKDARAAVKTNKLRAKAAAEGKLYIPPVRRKKGDPIDSDDDDGQDDAFDSDDNDEEIAKALADANKLPPISNIDDIFEDLTKNAPGLQELAELLSGETLKIATMCSGTESPLLALGLISRSLMAQFGVELNFSHGFSCEIEPFKQAYIERNFSPRTSS